MADPVWQIDPITGMTYASDEITGTVIPAKTPDHKNTTAALVLAVVVVGVLLFSRKG
ncbi:MAG: hypothetical protein WCO19_01905 [Candidatus Saccharibacteria bacterium]